MNIEARKIQLAQLLFNVETNKMLDKVEALLKGESTPQLSDELKAALDEAIESENYSTHLEVMERTKKRYPNLFK